MNRLFSVAFLLFILAMTTVIGAEPMVKEMKQRQCQAKSQRYKGPCSRDSNCASVCQTEGFTGGDCQGFRRRCFCTKFC